MTWSPAHIAVEQEDLPRLRDSYSTPGTTSRTTTATDGLCSAIDVEHDAHLQTGRPLHVDVAAFLLAPGADPLRPCNGMTVVAEAEIHRHWLAAEIMRAWTGRGRTPAEPQEGPG
jgi:uncharacterized protein